MDIDIDKTVRAFMAMGYTREQLLSTNAYMPIFINFETGSLSPEDFVKQLKEQLGDNIEDKDIKEAWNGMIVGIKKEKIDFLRDLKSDYRLYLLSNTNVFHEEVYSKMLKDNFGLVIAELFEKYYYSHLIGMAKPDPEIFSYVLQDSSLDPGETLFVDDNKDNIISAEKLGLRCLHFQENGDLKQVQDFLKEF